MDPHLFTGRDPHLRNGHLANLFFDLARFADFPGPKDVMAQSRRNNSALVTARKFLALPCIVSSLSSA